MFGRARDELPYTALAAGELFDLDVPLFMLLNSFEGMIMMIKYLMDSSIEPVHQRRTVASRRLMDSICVSYARPKGHHVLYSHLRY